MPFVPALISVTPLVPAPTFNGFIISKGVDLGSKVPP